MQTHNPQDTSKILDYWYVMEFLGQDSYEMSTGASENRRKVKNYKKKLEEMKRSGNKKGERRQINAFLDLKKGQSLYEVLKKECAGCGMGTWGKITVYLGRVKREACIGKIAECLEVNQEERPEKSYDHIAAASFQMDDSGRYIPYSFSLSAVLWAVNQLKGRKSRLLSDLLSVKSYQETVQDLEAGFWDLATEDRLDENVMGKASWNRPPVFSEEAVTMEDLEKIYGKIQKDYVNGLEGEELYGISVQFFKDQKTKDQCENDNYLGLSRSYFSNDLKMIKDQVESGKFDSGSDMGRWLIDYIHAPLAEEVPESSRRDLLRAGKEDLEFWLLEILNVKNAPIGKWPSRYSPALMQQIAVNFASAKERTGLLGENGPVFSVNGPPGTGKTTLLKEIVADHIVEKAKKLAVYEDPDDAFERNSFLHGEKEQKRYSKYIAGWYSFKDDSINDYSLLVASCNNAAVENITKELPVESGVLKNLKAASGDGADRKERLCEVERLFSVKEASQRERLFRKSDQEDEYEEIYFTEYAKRLFRNSDIWGLVAAPLGRKSNLTPFYHEVLSPLHWDFYPNKEFKDKRLEKYAAAKEKFQEQLEKVTGIKARLSALGEAARRLKLAEKESRENAAHCEASIDAEGKRLAALSEERETCREKLQGLERNLQEEMRKQAGLRAQLDTWKETWKKQKEAVLDARERALETRNSVGFLTKLFSKRKYEDAQNLAEAYKRQAEELEEEAAGAEIRIMELERELQDQERQSGFLEGKLEKEYSRLRDLEQQEKKSRDLIEAWRGELKSAGETVEKLRRHWESEAAAFREQEDAHRGALLDEDFVSALLSGEEREALKAQLTNPWTTEYYDREREKLLYHALQVTREFIVSSRSCRDNFTILGQYWGLEVNEDKERVSFHREDREAMAGALYQTLFLLVPVISSTFASIGSLLKDVKKPGIIGTLVVDEAGQAQPQMAVGALYRSRRAVIVGDPRQVEPVVTDELALLKKSYTEELYRHYQDKSLSVQTCADVYNPFGTYLENGTDHPEWVGCPLLVHRRCISPMYEISNRISYGGMMKQQTLPPGEEKERNFACKKSQWINVSGIENGKKDHFVEEQGAAACKILESAFEKEEFPSLYVISPFKSVVYGLRKYVRDYCVKNRNSCLNQSPETERWLGENTGTVHTFQGKEADQVIFLLGCDTGKNSAGAVRWVNSNIVNVAVTRAKYRLYVIGDIRAWEANRYIREMKAVIDTFALKEIAALQESHLDPEKKEQNLQRALGQMPGTSSFPGTKQEDEEGNLEYSLDTEGFLNNLIQEGFLDKDFREEELWAFGFRNQEEFEGLPRDIKKNLRFGIRLYNLLKPFFAWKEKLDASCCAILFCKALELQVQDCFAEGLKKQFPSHNLDTRRGRELKLRDAKKQDLMLGTIHFLLRKYAEEITEILKARGEGSLDAAWWSAFRKKLAYCTEKRNACCHAQLFLWEDLLALLQAGFSGGRNTLSEERQLGGVFFESAAGEKLR